MKHIRTYENYRIRKNREEIIKEASELGSIYDIKDGDIVEGYEEVEVKRTL